MKIKNKAFTLAESLILLLIVSLLAAALIPVITKKHKDVAAHGKWICTLNANGQHVIKTIIDGKDSGYKTTGASSCTFTPPANAKNFKLLAVGGGGGGAGGKSGDEDIVFDSRGGEESYAGNVTKEGTYTIVGVGGGGGGGGMGCGEAKNHVASHDFENHDCTPSYDYNWNQSTQSYGAKFPGCNGGSGTWNPEHEANYTYGYVDMAWPDWENKKNYEKLYQNIEEFTDQYRTNKTYYDPEFKKDYMNNYNYETFKNQIGCFSEKSPYTPNLSETPSKNDSGEYGLYYKGKGNYSSTKCWNLPGEGGHSGGSFSASNKSIRAGSSIYAAVGRAGEAQRSLASTESVGLYLPNNTKKTKNVYTGLDGKAGTDTIVNIGGQTFTGSGGAGGYSRQIVNITYKDIPVYECPVVEYTKTNWTNRTDCSGRSESSCGNTSGCLKKYTKDWKSCGGGGKCSDKTSYSSCYGYYEDVKQADGSTKSQYHSCYDVYGPEYFDYCYSGTHSGPAYKVDTAKCVKKIRKTYFSIPACINSNGQHPKEYPDYTKADYPYLVSPTKTMALEHLSGLGTTMDFGDYGSGGYGAGELSKTYIVQTNNGQYDFKLHGEAGAEGYVYIARVSYTGGGGGQAGSYISTMLKKTGKLKVVVGSVGAPSAMNSGANGSKGGDTIIYDADGSVLFTLKGGIGGIADSTKAEYSAGRVKGVNGTPSPMENQYNKAKITPYGGYNGNNTSIHGHTPLTEATSSITKYSYSSYTGGQPLDVTYGAGGGGGGATKTQAGNGGIGAPGAVIIEW